MMKPEASKVREGLLLILFTLVVVALFEYFAGYMVGYHEAKSFSQEYMDFIGPWGVKNDWGEYGDLPPKANRTFPYWRTRTYLMQTNQEGFRNIEDIDWSDDVVRILAIGDSQTFGPYLANEDTWPSWLEKTMRHRYGTHIQVLNAGIPAYTIEDELEYLKEKGLGIRPDMIVLGVFPNDVSDYRSKYRKGYVRSAKRYSQEGVPHVTMFEGESGGSWIESTNMYSLARIIKEVLSSDPDVSGIITSPSKQTATYMEHGQILYFNTSDPEAKGYWTSFEKDMASLVDIAKTNDIPLMIAYIPEHKQLPPMNHPPTLQEFLSNMSEDKGFVFSDQTSLFIEKGSIQSCYLLNMVEGDDMRYDGNAHLSRYGSYLFAEGVANSIDADERLRSIFSEGGR